ncbi:MAG: AAA family ATPase, partial [Clostridia bacterium]|nr:AAA family ATPase [Clostridia bacterium]
GIILVGPPGTGKTLLAKAIAGDDAVSEYFKDLVNTGYVSVFGKTFNFEDYEILQTEIDEARATYEGKTDDEIKVILQKIKMYNDMKDNYITVDELKKAVDAAGNDISDIIGNSFLVINNKVSSAYTFTSNSLTMSANKFYRVSVYVRTYNVTLDSKGAGVELYLGSANESDAPQIFNGITGTTDWTKYTFYIKTLDEDVTSVTIKLSLGEYKADDDTTLSSGYAMFDAVEIEIVDEDAFETAQSQIKEDAEFAAVNKAYVVPESSQQGDPEDDDDPVEEPDHKFDLQMLWWMIPTILLALATIAVVVVYAVRRFRKPKKATAETTSQEPSEAEEEKHTKND